MTTWRQYRSLFRIDREVDGPRFSVTVMCPYAFARVLWHFCPRDFKAWPNQYETSLVLGWRWPWRKAFREKKWAKFEPMPAAAYSAMDLVYLGRATPNMSHEDRLFVCRTVKQIADNGGAPCGHNYYLPSCPGCARKALYFATRQERVVQALTHQVKALGGKPVSFETLKLGDGDEK